MVRIVGKGKGNLEVRRGKRLDGLTAGSPITAFGDVGGG